ncbi:MAG: tRNA (N(6)-L-threonylcarbamoyladenosine(37)-C(2))-methylthiotransferase [Thermoplasmatota archaeon]
MRIYAEAYGCSLNRGQNREMLEAAEGRGHRLVERMEEADLLLLDTCTVIQSTENRMLDRLRAMRGAGKPVIVSGCMASAQPELVLRALPGALLIPVNERARLVKELAGMEAWGVPGEGRALRPGKNGEDGGRGMDAGRADHADSRPSAPAPGRRPPGIGAGSVAVEIPISSGCLGACTYCITRIARGSLRSRPVDEIVEAARALVSRGFRELRLTAQDSAAYGADTGADLPGLLGRVCGVEGDFRVRAGMMNPGAALAITPALLEAMRHPKMFKFLHLPLQSGDDGVLEAMGRRYAAEDFERVAGAFREAFPLGLLATDVIAGFPGEGEEEFRRTEEILERTRPDIINMKAFSPRPGTEAASIRGRPQAAEVKRRLARLRELHARVSLRSNTRLVGRVEEALVTEPGRRGTVLGRTPGYYPVVLENGPGPGTFCRARITEARTGYLVGEVVNIFK